MSCYDLSENKAICIVLYCFEIALTQRNGKNAPQNIVLHGNSYTPEGTFLPRKEGSFRGRKIFVRKEAFKLVY